MSATGPHIGREEGRVNTGLKKMILQLLPANVIVYRGKAQCGAVALSYDDGPHPTHSPRLLRLLKAEKLRATFFINGHPADRYPDLVRQMVADGHEIGNHFFTHDRIDQMNYRALRTQVEKLSATVVALTGTTPRLIRPPYGKITPQAIWYALCRRTPLLLWSFDTTDSLRNDLETIRSRIRNYSFRAGDIILMHEDFAQAVEVTSAVISKVRAAGLEFATASELLWGTSGDPSLKQ